MKKIPIAAAKLIAEKYGYDQVIVYGRCVDTGAEHMTTYGKTKAMCQAAGQMGKALQKWMGW
jgi:riboflavin synthase